MRVADLVANLAPRVRLLTGDVGLEATVRWVHASDLLDPSPYLRGGELVLTNGQWRRRAPDSRRFVGSVVAAEAVAIGYGLQQPGTRTPRDLITACAAAGVPLLEIPHDMAFVEISEVVATHYADARQRRLVRRLHRDEALLAGLRGGIGIDQILDMLVIDRSFDAVLVDQAGQLLAGALPAGVSVPTAALSHVVAGVEEPTDVHLNGATATVFPVMVHGAVEAFLVGFGGSGGIGSEDRAALEHELLFVGLELSHALAARQLTEQLVDELVEILAAGEARLPDLRSRLRSLGVDPTRTITALAVVAEERTDATAMRRVARITARHLAARGIAAVVPLEARSALVIASVEVDQVDLAVELADALGREGYAVSVGVGSLVDAGVGDLGRSIAEARLAADFAHGQRGPRRVATHAQAGSFRVLLAGQSRAVKSAFAEAVLGPVLAQDRARGTELVKTLEAFLRGSGHWQTVAGGLHLHVNTLRYRIARVELLTGRSLSSFEERVNLFIALEALREQVPRLDDPPN